MRKVKPLIPERPPRSCGKNRYRSREEADAAGRDQEFLFMADDLKLKSYRCVTCGSWHLTKVTIHHI
ncbi:hypothetical protein FWC31_02525 [Candidatus Saccharibacteria bacterium]|nr:hypothetical protein [Candidatus Saccharibacteria bacterium]